jgi:hypothetical protein
MVVSRCIDSVGVDSTLVAVKFIHVRRDYV